MNNLSPKKYDHSIKLIVIGNSGVGKSNFLCRYVTGSFDREHDMTIGVEFFTKIILHNGLVYKVNIWDTAGEESFCSITRIYYRGCVGCVVMYDVTNQDSFADIEKWVTEARNNSSDKLFIVLVANKCDMVDRRVVSPEDGRNTAKRLGLAYIETSALTGDHVADPFAIIMANLDQVDTKHDDTIIIDSLTEPINMVMGQDIPGWRCNIL